MPESMSHITFEINTEVHGYHWRLDVRAACTVDVPSNLTDNPEALARYLGDQARTQEPMTATFRVLSTSLQHNT
jgi:hypothetical protein